MHCPSLPILTYRYRSSVRARSPALTHALSITSYIDVSLQELRMRQFE
jgi:hypothetical protein